MKAYVSYHVDRINKSVDMNISYISWEDGKENIPNMMKFSKDINLIRDLQEFFIFLLFILK